MIPQWSHQQHPVANLAARRSERLILIIWLVKAKRGRTGGACMTVYGETHSQTHTPELYSERTDCLWQIFDFSNQKSTICLQLDF